MNFIKRILTALMNENVNNELRKKENIEVVSNDLLYQEAVLDYINQNKNIDFLLLNENLPGEKIETFIEKINKVKIILFVEKSRKNKEILLKKGVYKIYTNGEISVEKISEIIENSEDNYTQKLENEIKELKRKIEQKENIKNDTRIKNYFKEITKHIKKEKYISNKIIAITGNNSNLKAIISVEIAKQLEKKKIKTLLIDFDILDQDTFTLLHIKNKEEKNLKLENHIINKNKYLSMLSGINILFKINEKITIYEIEQIIEKLREKYQYIIINTSAECQFELHKKILEKTNIILFTMEKSLKNIENSINLLKIYLNNWNIKEEKFKIILTKIEKIKTILKIKILEIIPYFTNNKNIENLSKYQSSNRKKLLKEIETKGEKWNEN